MIYLKLLAKTFLQFQQLALPCFLAQNILSYTLTKLQNINTMAKYPKIVKVYLPTITKLNRLSSK